MVPSIAFILNQIYFTYHLDWGEQLHGQFHYPYFLYYVIYLGIWLICGHSIVYYFF